VVLEKGNPLGSTQW